MTNEQKCPPECQVELRTLHKKSNDICDARERAWQNYRQEQTKQWEIIDQNYKTLEKEVNMRVKTQTLVAVFGIITTVLLTLIGLTFDSLHSAQENAVKQLKESRQEQLAVITKNQDRIEETLKELDRKVDRSLRTHRDDHQ